MNTVGRFRQLLDRPDRLSYLVMLVLLILTSWLGLGGLLLTALFSYLALNVLTCGHRVSRWLAVMLFLVLVTGGIYTLFHFAKHFVLTFPEIADRAIPSFIHWAKQNDIELPFSDFETLQETAKGAIATQVKYLGSFARFVEGAGRHVIFMAAGFVAAISLFLNSRFELGREPHVKPNNLYSLAGEQLSERFLRFFRSFSIVMGAQIIISAINTIFTAIYALAVHLPYTPVIVGVTFLCGLLPVIGNLMSNTIIVAIGFTVSPAMAISALIFLIVIHKLEYFLNSTIIGRKIRNPLWLTLIGLVIGEKLMGIPGIVLAPVILHYIKMEASNIEVTKAGKREMPMPVAD